MVKMTFYDTLALDLDFLESVSIYISHMNDLEGNAPLCVNRDGSIN